MPTVPAAGHVWRGVADLAFCAIWGFKYAVDLGRHDGLVLKREPRILRHNGRVAPDGPSPPRRSSSICLRPKRLPVSIQSQLMQWQFQQLTGCSDMVGPTSDAASAHSLATFNQPSRSTWLRLRAGRGSPLPPIASAA